MRSKNPYLAIVLFVALVVRVIPCAFHNFELEPISSIDSPLYLNLAENLLERASFERTTALNSLENPWSVEIFRTPGYPLFLAVVFGLFGPSLMILVLLQIVMDLGIVAMCYLLAKRIMHPTGAALASLLFAFDVPHIVQSNMVMSDILFTFVLSLALFWLSTKRFWSLKSGSSLGLLITVAALIRPVGFFVGVIAAVYLWFTGQPKRAAMAVLIAALLFPVAWTFRNGAAVGVYTPSSAFSFNVYLLSAGKLKARGEGIARHEATRRLGDKALSRLAEEGHGRWHAILREVGSPAYRKNLDQIPIEVAASLAEMMFAGERRHLLRIFGSERGHLTQPSISESKRSFSAVWAYLKGIGWAEVSVIVAQLLWNVLLWIGFTRGLWRLYQARQYPFMLLSIGVIGYILGASIIVATARMRIPFALLFYVVTGYGVAPNRLLNGSASGSSFKRTSR